MRKLLLALMITGLLSACAEINTQIADAPTSGPSRVYNCQIVDAAKIAWLLLNRKGIAPGDIEIGHVFIYAKKKNREMKITFEAVSLYYVGPQQTKVTVVQEHEPGMLPSRYTTDQFHADFLNFFEDWQRKRRPLL
jgi:uncharacterized protein YceK